MKESNFAAKIGYGELEERLEMLLSGEDLRKTGCRRGWQTVVRDLNTGKKYFTRARSCCTPAGYCDAIATEVVVKAGKKPNLLKAAKVALSMLQELQAEYEEESMLDSPMLWPEIDALAMGIRLEEGKRARQTESRTRGK